MMHCYAPLLKTKIMAEYCEDCGCKVYGGRCTNCHEELYILDQYYELQGTNEELPIPDESTDFMKKVHECEADIARKANGA